VSATPKRGIPAQARSTTVLNKTQAKSDKENTGQCTNTTSVIYKAKSQRTQMRLRVKWKPRV
jgi:hypothetical protein